MSCTVSVVIVSWNVREFVSACLTSVFAESSDVSLEVTVVDNASADGTADVIRAEFPQVHLIANSTNRGFAAACNQGMEIAQGRFVLLLNPDTRILDRAIQKSVARIEELPECGVLGCQVLLSEDEIQGTCFSFPGPMNLLLGGTGLHRLFPGSRFFGRPELSWWDRRSERTVEVVSGMFMLVRREAIDAVGPMDDSYFVYAEEADWCFRFWKAGWQCVFSPVARIIHVDGGGKSTARIAVRMYVQHQKSLLIFNRKNLGPMAWFLAKLVLLVSNGARALLWWRNEPARARARSAAAALRYHLTGIEPSS